MDLDGGEQVFGFNHKVSESQLWEDFKSEDPKTAINAAAIMATDLIAHPTTSPFLRIAREVEVWLGTDTGHFQLLSELTGSLHGNK